MYEFKVIKIKDIKIVEEIVRLNIFLPVIKNFAGEDGFHILYIPSHEKTAFDIMRKMYYYFSDVLLTSRNNNPIDMTILDYLTEYRISHESFSFYNGYNEYYTNLFETRFGFYTISSYVEKFEQAFDITRGIGGEVKHIWNADI